jgi:hypothetical protein
MYTESMQETFNTKENDPGEAQRELARHIVERPIVRKALAKYVIFSDLYFTAPDEAQKELIQRRADAVFGDDALYKKIVDSGRPVTDDDFVDHVLEEIRQYPEAIGRLQRAQADGNLDEALAMMNIEREARQRDWEVIGKLGMELSEDGTILSPHLSRISDDPKETGRQVNESYRLLAERLQTDKRFEKIERIQGLSWLLGGRYFDRQSQNEGSKLVWHRYTAEELAEIKHENPKGYEEAEKTGLVVSPRLLRAYLERGKMPEIGGGWVSKEAFIKRYGGVNTVSR